MHELSVEHREAGAAVRRILYAQLPSRALVVVAQLGIPDLLADEPLALPTLAERTGTDAATLARLLRSLSVFGLFEESTEQVYSLTPLGEALTSAHPASALPSAKLVAGDFGSAWADLLTTVRTGQSPFERSHGTDLFTHMERDEELRGTFDNSQGCGLTLELDEILREVDFSPYSTVVDVGGSDGTFLRRVLEATPGINGIVFDLPSSTSRLLKQSAPDPLSGRYSVITGDFFEKVPEGGDLYLLSHILHDWDDDKAVEILKTCRAAMSDTASLMVVDLVAADRGQHDERLHTAALMDLYMLSLFGGTGGQERTAAQVEVLLEKAGFRLTQVDALPSGMNVIHAIPAT
ncbi:methyltransferase [Streptomyces sp. NPDC048272]|uniref:methyltransferase n=1 Tax=Streptomyces sp. NPDC048272 TaxID=3154616 RepID=UPI003420E495